MGNKQSTLKDPKCPYTILGLQPTATPAEIKRQYHRLLLRYHPDRNTTSTTDQTILIMQAYDKIKDGTYKPIIPCPDLTPYTKMYFSNLKPDDFFTEVNRIYRDIIAYENTRKKDVNWPSFGDAGAKVTGASMFYVFFRGFKSVPGFTEEVRRVTRVVQAVDPRLKRTVFEAVCNKPEIKVVKIKKKKVKKSVDKYTYYCDACSKGFMGDKTMINHVRSEKHKKKVIELGVEEVSIEEILKGNKNDEMCYEKEYDTENNNKEQESIDDIENNGYNVNNDIESNNNETDNHKDRVKHDDDSTLNNDIENTNKESVSYYYREKCGHDSTFNNDIENFNKGQDNNYDYDKKNRIENNIQSTINTKNNIIDKIENNNNINNNRINEPCEIHNIEELIERKLNINKKQEIKNNLEIIKETNKDINKEINKETINTHETNKEINKEINEEINNEINKKTNIKINKETINTHEINYNKFENCSKNKKINNNLDKNTTTKILHAEIDTNDENAKLINNTNVNNNNVNNKIYEDANDNDIKNIKIVNNTFDREHNNNQTKSNKIVKKTRRKKKIDIKESIDFMTCSYCKNTFLSRNKLFEHIKNEHLKKL
ncbi:hypothetical protein COBT_002347 [Conglomerata obtusa]